MMRSTPYVSGASGSDSGISAPFQPIGYDRRVWEPRLGAADRAE